MPKALIFILLLLAANAFATNKAIDRWAKALGGQDKIATIKSLYREATVQVGEYEGTIKVWHTADGKYRKEEKIATFANIEAFDGDNGTIQQGVMPSRKMTDAELTMTKSKRFANWNAILFLLFPERHHGSINIEGENTISFTPEGGVEWRVNLDPQTALPKTMTHTEADHTIKVEFISYETIDGIQFEKEIQRSGTDPKMNAVIRFTKTVVNPTIDVSLFSIH